MKDWNSFRQSINLSVGDVYRLSLPSIPLVPPYHRMKLEVTCSSNNIKVTDASREECEGVIRKEFAVVAVSPGECILYFVPKNMLTGKLVTGLRVIEIPVRVE